MNAVISVTFAAVVVALACSVPVQRNKRWTIRRTLVEPAPGLSGSDLKDVLATAPDIRYSDLAKRLTAQKSSKFKACFIVDLDPDFYLLETEMDKITMEKEPEVIDSPPAYYRFRQKAGTLLTAMCENMDIFWLNLVAPPLPVSHAPPLKLPQPIPIRNEIATPHLVTDAPPQPIPVGNEVAPPLLMTKIPLLKPPQPAPVGNNNAPLPVPHAPRTPPPVHVYRQLQQEQERNRPILTPPPVELYHRQQMGNQNAV